MCCGAVLCVYTYMQCCACVHVSCLTGVHHSTFHNETYCCDHEVGFYVYTIQWLNVADNRSFCNECLDHEALLSYRTTVELFEFAWPEIMYMIYAHTQSFRAMIVCCTACRIATKCTIGVYVSICILPPACGTTCTWHHWVWAWVTACMTCAIYTPESIVSPPVCFLLCVAYDCESC